MEKILVTCDDNFCANCEFVPVSAPIMLLALASVYWSSVSEISWHCIRLFETDLPANFGAWNFLSPMSHVRSCDIETATYSMRHH